MAAFVLSQVPDILQDHTIRYKPVGGTLVSIHYLRLTANNDCLRRFLLHLARYFIVHRSSACSGGGEHWPWPPVGLNVLYCTPEQCVFGGGGALAMTSCWLKCTLLYTGAVRDRGRGALAMASCWLKCTLLYTGAVRVRGGGSIGHGLLLA